MKSVSLVANMLETLPDNTSINIEVHGTYYPACKGHRDKYGAPEEPDEEASFEVTDVSINNVSMDDNVVAELLGITEDELLEKYEAALFIEFDAYTEDMFERRAEQAKDNRMFNDIYDFD